MTEQYLDGITPRDVHTSRLRTHLLESNPEADIPVLFIHGNVASSRRRWQPFRGTTED